MFLSLKLVRVVGLEPTRLIRAGDFESPVSTNFTTPAEAEPWERSKLSLTPTANLYLLFQQAMLSDTMYAQATQADVQ